MTTNLISNVLLLEMAYDDHIHLRFIRAFESAWKGIPDGGRKAIYKYLKGRPGRAFLCYRMDYGCHVAEPWGRFCWCDHATLFTFNAAFVEGATPLEGVCSVIAHELAHCYRKAVSLWTPIEDEEERGVRELTRSWGFEEPAPQDADVFAAEIERWRSESEASYGRFTESAVLKKHGFKA